jgi:hypothetical protein
MDETLKKGLYYLGIVAAVYLFFYYILPIAISIVGFALKAIFYIFIWAALAFVIVLLVTHVVKIVRKEI